MQEISGNYLEIILFSRNFKDKNDYQILFKMSFSTDSLVLNNRGMILRIALITIILLLVANLTATVWFGLDSDRSDGLQGSNPVKQAKVHQLPEFLNSQVRDEIYKEFARSFNSGDYEALYNMFGQAAKAQFNKEAALKEFEKLSKFFHSVQEGAFTHSEHVGDQGNTNYYQLNYAVKLSEKSEFGPKGTLKVTVALQNEEYQIYGIRLNGG